MADIKFVRMRFTNADELKTACDAYFDRIDNTPPKSVCVRNAVVFREIPYTPAGLARALGISTSTMGKYLRGEVSFPDKMPQKTQDEILKVLTDARMRIEDDITTRALIGEVDNAVARQVMGMLGYNKSMDEAGEEANNKVLVLVQGASKADIENWSK